MSGYDILEHQAPSDFTDEDGLWLRRTGGLGYYWWVPIAEVEEFIIRNAEYNTTPWWLLGGDRVIGAGSVEMLHEDYPDRLRFHEDGIVIVEWMAGTWDDAWKMAHMGNIRVEPRPQHTVSYSWVHKSWVHNRNPSYAERAWRSSHGSST